MTIATPTIHLNGTSAGCLRTDLSAATISIQNAVAALAETAPNGRDYYTQGPRAYEQARIEHQTRMHKLADVIRELRIIGEAIVAQEAA